MPGAIENIFGKSGAEKRLKKFKPAGFNTAGVSGAFDKESNTFNLTRSEGLEQSLAGITSGFRKRGEEFSRLRGEITDKVTGFTRSRINRLRANRQRTVGNIRSELQSRRVLGSSFAQASIAGAEAEFALAEDEIFSEGQLIELELERSLIFDETQAGIDAANTLLEQFNFETTLGANLSVQAGTQIQSNLTVSAQAAAAQAPLRMRQPLKTQTERLYVPSLTRRHQSGQRRTEAVRIFVIRMGLSILRTAPLIWWYQSKL